jgi:hypothetical protein
MTIRMMPVLQRLQPLIFMLRAYASEVAITFTTLAPECVLHGVLDMKDSCESDAGFLSQRHSQSSGEKA